VVNAMFRLLYDWNLDVVHTYIEIYTPSTQEGPTLPLYYNVSINLVFRTHIAPVFTYFLPKVTLLCNFI
jgi:hypothetical protein